GGGVKSGKRKAGGLLDLEEGEATAGGVVIRVVRVEEADLGEALPAAIDGAEHQARPECFAGGATPAGPRHVPGVAPAVRTANDGGAGATGPGATVVEPLEQSRADLTNLVLLEKRLRHDQGMCRLRARRCAKSEEVCGQSLHEDLDLGRARIRGKLPEPFRSM